MEHPETQMTQENPANMEINATIPTIPAFNPAPPALAAPAPAPIVVHQDNSAFPTGIMLDETNFSLWSQLMEMRIGARNKAGYLTGDIEKPGPGDPRLEIWITENHRVKSWLIESMNPSLMRRFICLPTAKEIWDAVSRTFYDGADETTMSWWLFSKKLIVGLPPKPEQWTACFTSTRPWQGSVFTSSSVASTQPSSKFVGRSYGKTPSLTSKVLTPVSGESTIRSRSWTAGPMVAPPL